MMDKYTAFWAVVLTGCGIGLYANYKDEAHLVFNAVARAVEASAEETICVPTEAAATLPPKALQP